MYIEIRPITARHGPLMEMLKFNVAKMVHALNANGIMLNDDCVKIWIKQYSDEIFYPKIEFDSDRQEIQFDMSTDGEIKEIHYKRFTGTRGRSNRIDISRAELKPSLLAIDMIIRQEYGYFDGLTAQP